MLNWKINVKLKNTFGTWNDTISNPITDEHFFDTDEDNTTKKYSMTMNTRSNTGGLTRADIENFEEVGAVKVSLVDKILRLSPSYLKHTKIQFKSNSKRKLYVSLYRYDYVFGISIGLDCKVFS